VRIGAGEIEGEAERLLGVLIDEHAEGPVERAQVLGIAAAVRQGDVEVARGLRNGKFFAPWSEIVNTLGSPAKIAAVPSPWWTSRSTTTILSRGPRPAGRATRPRRR
jgi:hypothetical protein